MMVTRGTGWPSLVGALLVGVCIIAIAGRVIFDHTPDEFGQSQSPNDTAAYIWFASGGLVLVGAIMMTVLRFSRSGRKNEDS